MTLLILALGNYAVTGLNIHLYLENSNMLNLVIAAVTFGLGQATLPEALERLSKVDLKWT